MAKFCEGPDVTQDCSLVEVKSSWSEKIMHGVVSCNVEIIVVDVSAQEYVDIGIVCIADVFNDHGVPVTLHLWSRGSTSPISTIAKKRRRRNCVVCVLKSRWSASSKRMLG